jgi:hypothetical protein
MVFGINCNNKWIGNFLTGFALSVLSLSMSQIAIPISLNDELKFSIVRISCSLTIFSKIITILIIKYYSEKIFRVYDQIEEYQIKIFDRYNNNFSIIISILFAFISAGITTSIYYWDFYFSKLFKELTETQELLPINQKIQMFLIHFYIHSWKILLHLMYREFNNRYISIMESFIQELSRKFNKPDRLVIINAQRTVLKLTEFRSNFKKNLGFIKYFIVIDVISMSGILIFSLVNIPTYYMNFNFYSIPYLIMMSINFFFTIKSGLNVSKKSEELCLKFNQWKHFKIEGMSLIEMKVLERTIQLFKLNENIQLEDVI